MRRSFGEGLRINIIRRNVHTCLRYLFVLRREGKKSNRGGEVKGGLFFAVVEMQVVMSN
jgi:hypothetical protein